MRTLVALAVLALMSVPVHAQDFEDEPEKVFEGHVVGLLSVPTIMPPNPCAPVKVGNSVPLYLRPGDAAPIGELRVIRGPLGADAIASSCKDGPEVHVVLPGRSFPVATEEHAYEESSLVVTTASHGWYQIRTGGEPGLLWLRHTSGSTYRNLAALFEHGMTYLTETWDGRLYTRPSGTSTVSHNGLPDEQGVVLYEMVRVAGASWARVTFIEHCTDDKPPPRPTGWVKIHAPKPSEVPVVWFYARGC